MYHCGIIIIIILLPVGMATNLPAVVPHHHDPSGMDASLVEYEIPEKIRMLHQLALQHVNQVGN